ncbi:MAG: PHP domain-containing protein [Microcoleaceae cyanobacterium]
MLELHCHTTYSDGTLTPTELVNKAASCGVQALALTDHDTLSGWDEAINVAAEYNIEIIPGLELSTVHNGCSLHILGYYPNYKKLLAPLSDRIAGRHRRAKLMVENLAKLGYPVELPTMGRGIAPGRPHIAMALVKAGYVRSPQEAFERWLGDNKPAYVHYEKFSIVEGINLLHSCGAVAVWAHPYLFRGGKVKNILPEMVEAGLTGLEVFHPCHSPTQVQNLQQLCQKYGLFMTGGSDYHGPNSQGKEQTTLNMLNLPLELLAPLKQAAGV